MCISLIYEYLGFQFDTFLSSHCFNLSENLLTHLKSDKGIVHILKSSFQFTQKVRGDPEISFTSADLLIEGLLREIGANFPPKKLKPDEVKELDIRKFLLSVCMGKLLERHTMIE